MLSNLTLDNSMPLQICMRELVSYARSYLSCASSTSEETIQKCLSILNSSPNAEVSFNQMNPTIFNCLQCLCQLISVVDTESQILWKSISFIKKLFKYQETRSMINSYLNCVQLITNHYPNVTDLERKVSLLHLLRELTYGIELRWPHTYLDDLISILFNNILSGDENENIVILSLVILINICFKNPTATVHVIQKMPCSISKFYARVDNKQKYLTRKLMFVFKEHNHCLNIVDYSYFIMKSFMDVEHAISSLNAPLLKQCVEILFDMKNENFLTPEAYNTVEFVEKLTHLLQLVYHNIDAGKAIALADEENRSLCASNTFQYFQIILDLDLDLQSLHQSLLRLATKWLMNKEASCSAYNLITKICKHNLNQLESELQFSDLIKTLGKVIENIIEEENQLCCEQISSLLQLLAILVDNTRLTVDIQKFADDKFFNRIFLNLKLTDGDEFQANTCTTAEISMYVNGLWTLSRFSNVAQITWFSTMLFLLKTKQMQKVLARAFYTKDIDLVEKTLILSKLPEFPDCEIAHYIIENNSTTIPTQIPKDTSFFSQPKFNAIKQQTELGKNLDELINKIEGLNREELINISRVDIMELYENQKIMLNITNDMLKRSLTAATDEVSGLKYQLGYLIVDNAEIRNKLVLLGLENEKQLEKIKHFENEQKDFRVSFRTLCESETKLKLEKEELEEKIKTMNKANNGLREELKNKMEIDRMLMQLRKDYAEQELNIKHLISQLGEKNKEIESLQVELNDAEKIKDTIMGLMNKKRKN